MENIFCQSCGQSVLPNMKLCPQCGGRSFDNRPPALEALVSKPPMETPSQTSPSSGAAGLTKNTQSSNAMSFTDAIKVCISKFIDFDGRASRTEFWYWTLFHTLLQSAAMIFDTAVLMGEGVTVTYFSVLIITALPNFAVSVRRLHDINKSGWWLLLNLIVIGLPVVIYFFCQKSTAGKNNYGELD